jgi:hypothetical protein
MSRQLGQEPAVPGAISLKEAAGQTFSVESIENKTGQFGNMKVIHRSGGPNPPNQPIVIGAKATAFAQLEKESPPPGTRLRVVPQVSKKSHQTAYILEVVD